MIRYRNFPRQNEANGFFGFNITSVTLNGEPVTAARAVDHDAGWLEVYEKDKVEPVRLYGDIETILEIDNDMDWYLIEEFGEEAARQHRIN